MNLSALINFQHENSGEQANNINVFVTNALIYIIENYFVQLAPSFVLTLNCRQRETCNFYNDILIKLFKIWESPPIQIVNLSQNESLYVPGRRYFNLILVDSYESFQYIDVIKYSGKYNNNEYYYIFLQTRDREIPNEMFRIFEYCWKHYIINCNVQIQTAQGDVLIYTYFPFTPEGCNQIQPKLINKFNGTSLMNKTLFPNKLVNFYGCTLRVATWHVPPFLYLDHSNGSLKISHGIEGRVVLELARKLNFSIEVLEPANNEQRGVINGDNMTGALLMLENRLVDLSLGCFRLSYERTNAVTASFSYYQSTQVICVVNGAYEFSSMEILLYPFSTSTWSLLLIIWFILIIFVTLINKFYYLYPSYFEQYTPTHSHLNMLLMAFGMPAIRMPIRIFGRLLCTNWMLFALVIRTAYQALLFHLTRTRPTNHIPTSFSDLVDNNYTVAMNYATLKSLDGIQFLRDLELVILNQIDDTVAFKYVENHLNKRLVAAGPVDFLAYYGIKYKKVGVFQLIPQDIVQLPLAMYFTKHSFLIDQFNRELLRMRSMGFIQIFWRWELDYNYLRSRRNMKNQVFGLDELNMVFFILLAGSSVSFFVFVLELFSKKSRFLRKIFANV